MKQKLTAQIAAAYWGAKIWIEDVALETHAISLFANGNIQVAHSIGSQDHWCILYCQLILTPLSKVSDEDAVECAKLASYHPDLKEDWENIICDFQVDKIVRHTDGVEIKHTCICFEGSFHIRFDGSMFMSGEYGGSFAEPTIYLPHYGIDYLRSKGYDCGYGNIPSLIEAGIAIENTAQ